MDGKNPPEFHLCLALLGEQNRVILQLSDEAGEDRPARLYVHSQVDGPQTVALLSDLLLHLSRALLEHPDYFHPVRLPEDTRVIFRYIGG